MNLPERFTHMPSSVILFANDVLASDSVKLGQFVLDVDIPTEGYYPFAVQEDDVEVVDTQLYDIIETGLAKGVDLDVEFIKSASSHTVANYSLLSGGF